MPRPLPYTDDELRDAVRLSKSLREMCGRLHVLPGGKTYDSLRRHIARLDLDVSHMSEVAWRRRTAPRLAWTDDELRDIVSRCRSISQVLDELGYAPSGGMYRWIKGKLARLDIDTTHFTGQAWSAGRRDSQRKRRRALVEVLVAGSTCGSRLRLRLIAAGVKEDRCEICSLSDWRGAELSLELDHINGDPTDNRIENLRILCPNCHAQTETWCGRNRKHA